MCIMVEKWLFIALGRRVANGRTREEVASSAEKNGKAEASKTEITAFFSRY